MAAFFRRRASRSSPRLRLGLADLRRAPSMRLLRTLPQAHPPCQRPLVSCSRPAASVSSPARLCLVFGSSPSAGLPRPAFLPRRRSSDSSPHSCSDVFSTLPHEEDKDETVHWRLSKPVKG